MQLKLMFPMAPGTSNIALISVLYGSYLHMFISASVHAEIHKNVLVFIYFGLQSSVAQKYELPGELFKNRLFSTLALEILI